MRKKTDHKNEWGGCIPATHRHEPPLSLTIRFINFLLFQSEIFDDISLSEKSLTDTGH